MITIGLVGDVHGEHKRPALEQFVADERPDMLLQVGDLQTYRGMPVETWFVRGNHECYAVLAEMASGARRPPNLNYLADGKSVQVEGLKIEGIGGNWSPANRQAPRFIPHDYLERMAKSGRPDILLTHETGLRFPERPELTLLSLRKAIVEMRPLLAVSGHHHHWATEQIGRTRLVSLGKWPHEWAVLVLDAGRIIALERHIPKDRAAYNAAMPGWLQAERAEKDRLYPLDKSGGWYGVSDGPKRG